MPVNRFSILDLLATYCQSFDDRDFDKLATVWWADDAVLVIGDIQIESHDWIVRAIGKT